MNMKIIGMIPNVSHEELRIAGFAPLPLRSASVKRIFPREILFTYRPLSVVSQAYRTLRTGLLQLRPTKPPQSILFTGREVGEGTTLTAVNIAIALAQMKARVLLIDANLRHPECHKLLRIPPGPGLAEFLNDQEELNTLLHLTAVEHLILLQAGIRIPSLTAISRLGSKDMQSTFVFLQKMYDYVIIDAPPVEAESYVPLLSTLVDGVVLVVNPQLSPSHSVQEVGERLLQAQAQLCGMVLSRVEAQSREYTDFYRRDQSQSLASEEPKDTDTDLPPAANASASATVKLS